MSIEIPQRAFVQLEYDVPENRIPSLPEEMSLAIISHMHSWPTSLYLPWPVTLFPPERSKICLYGLHTPDLYVMVDEVSYSYLKKDGVVAYAKTKSVLPGDWLVPRTLYKLGREGLLFESMEPVQDVLLAAGLWENLQEQFAQP